MPRLLRFLKIAGINIILLILLLEIFSTGFYYFKDGQYFSVPEKLAAETSSFDIEKPDNIACNKHGNVLAPHPYLVFIHPSRPECKSRSNNTGHRGPDVPLTKNPEHYTVMILGGSVANQLFQFKSEEIRAYFQKKHPRKNIVILNGALEGWKQPQQLFMLQMYGEVIDAALSIEGYNEMMFNYRLGYNLRFDAPFLAGYRKANPGFLTPREQFAMGASAWMFDTLNNNPFLRYSKTAYFISDRIRSGLAQEMNAPAENPGEVSSKNATLKHLEKVFRLPTEWTLEQKRQHALQQYLKYISLMDATAKAYGISLAIFLQPAPALHKTLSAEEKNNVGSLDYRDDYLLFEKTLLKQGNTLPVYSLLEVFSNTHDTLYKDGIHYYRESAGPDLIMRRIYQTLDKENY
jgi:hypothetical protein